MYGFHTNGFYVTELAAQVESMGIVQMAQTAQLANTVADSDADTT